MSGSFADAVDVTRGLKLARQGDAGYGLRYGLCGVWRSVMIKSGVDSAQCWQMTSEMRPPSFDNSVS